MTRQICGHLLILVFIIGVVVFLLIPLRVALGALGMLNGVCFRGEGVDFFAFFCLFCIDFNGF